MSRSTLIALNIALIALAIAVSGRMIFRWVSVRPETVMNLSPICDESSIAFQAHYLAFLCHQAIKSGATLPQNSVDVARLLGTEAVKLGKKWPGDYQTNSTGELVDCYGAPFEILVAADRITVSSPSSYAFYFAGLPPPREPGAP